MMKISKMLGGSRTPSDRSAATADSGDSHSHSDSQSSGHNKSGHSSNLGALFRMSSLNKSSSARSSPSHSVASNQFIVAKDDYSKLGTTVRQILENPSIAKRFKEYAASLHADEGLRFLDDLKKAHESTDHVATAEQLMKTYFIDDAEHQVNLPDNIRSDLLERFRSSKYATVAELFNDATYEIFTDIKKSDTFRNFIQMDDEAKRISSDETLILDRWLVSDNFRDALRAVSEDIKLSNLVRFCASVNEFEKEEDKTARKARGNKISATFVQTGSTFQVTLPAYYEEAILGSKFQILPDARIECLQILAKNPLIMEAARKGLTERRPSKAPSRDYASTNRTHDLQQMYAHGAGKAFVQRLIDMDLESKNKVLLNKARFCSAVASYVALSDSNEKLGAARKIVSTFVQVGSLFQVDLATGFVEDLVNAKTPDYDQLFGVIYQQYVSDLGSTEVVELALDTVHM